ncbi:MAG: polyphosphate kinase 2 family protein [Sedimentisphaerales bacterium]|nr:polyphosphate kinase 2 family protein [Sedimentisphaerales bacterium]
MRLSERYRVKPDSKVNLGKWDPDDTLDFKDSDSVKKKMKKNLKRLSELQYLLYAENKRSVLIVLQALDAGGKDGTIRHVMGPLNPQSCKVISFKTPTAEELAHDFLWRIHRAAPRAGEIRIFNRSHYEDVLIVRVHGLVPKSVWSRRYEQINAFERMLTQNNTHILKFYLHISKDEQLERFKARLEDPTKLWKASKDDFEERKYWNAYAEAYQAALSRCSTTQAPWFIIPANKKWFRNFVVSEILVEYLSKLRMKFPQPADLSAIEPDQLV